MKSCFLFGHSDCPDTIIPKLESSIENAISNGVTQFYVGNRGNFDRLSTAAVKRLKVKYREVELFLVLAYHPAERTEYLSEGIDGSIYPLSEKVPKRFAIIRANEEMIHNVDLLICYVNHPGNTQKLLAQAQKIQRRQALVIENLA